jgi:hypothetical protein
VAQCDDFFKTVSEVRKDFRLSLNCALDPVRQTAAWDKAAAGAFEKVEQIVKQIDEAARTFING